MVKQQEVLIILFVVLVLQTNGLTKTKTKTKTRAKTEILLILFIEHDNQCCQSFCLIVVHIGSFFDNISWNCVEIAYYNYHQIICNAIYFMLNTITNTLTLLFVSTV